MVAIDFNYTFRSAMGTSCLDVSRTLARHKYNIHPLIYDVEGATACDPTGYRALGLVYLVLSQFALSPFNAITMTHTSNYMDHAWLTWCELTVESFKQSQPLSVATDTRCMDTLLRTLNNDMRSHFNYDPAASHGVLEAEEFLERIEKWRPLPGDEAGARRTHAVIISTLLTTEPLPVPKPPPTLESTSGDAQTLPEPINEESHADMLDRVSALAERCGLGPQPYESLNVASFTQVQHHHISHTYLRYDEHRTSSIP